ncbi:hypothetical protein [Motiliproteus sp. MSK22-1]|uniref:hypothetical protein n=1 Tax=Motiliproteus sp. MSK22-1 TaxID=1897630 RepID=UPI00097680F1|nr:hypothetical protein [Motiliproteus sp. MSK22-1]OMH39760.1 hypothetical protein BGP75_01510 [Motiliproteus sp. MSK22-1]
MDNVTRIKTDSSPASSTPDLRVLAGISGGFLLIEVLIIQAPVIGLAVAVGIIAWLSCLVLYKR